MVWDPRVGPVAWPGGPPVAAIPVIQAQQAAIRAQAAAEVEAVRRAKEEMRASGVKCHCGIPAVGRCATCDRAFCDTHQSTNRTTIGHAASLTQCRDCQGREVARATAEARAAQNAAEEARRKAREREERECAEHAALVAVWEGETGWSAASERVAWLSARIDPREPRWPATGVHAVGAALVGVADLGVLMTIAGGISADNSTVAALGLVLVLVMLWPTGWAAWAAVRWVRQRRRRDHIQERRELLRLRGCGEPGCARCAARAG